MVYRDIYIGLVTSLCIILALNIGVEWGVQREPVFNASRYVESQCDEIARHNGGLRCMVAIQEEDDPVRVFKPVRTVAND